MSILKTGIVQHCPGPDVEANRSLLAAEAEKLAAEGAGLVVLPELHDTPYFCITENVGCFNLAEPSTGSAAEAFYSALAARLGVVLVTSRFERRAPGLCHNTAYVYEADGSLAGTYRKMHIPDDPGYYEKFYFTPGDLGFEPIETSVGRLGVLVCWDQWFPEAARLMALNGAELLIYPTAIGHDLNDTPEEQARQLEAWVTVQRGHAVANGLPVVTANRVGPQEGAPDTRFWGSSFVAGPQGELLWQAPADKPVSATVDIDLARSETVRRWWPFLRDRRIDAYQGLLKRYGR